MSDNRTALLRGMGTVANSIQPEPLVQWRVAQKEPLEKMGVAYVTTVVLVLGNKWRLIEGSPNWLLMRVKIDPFYEDRRGYPMPKLVIDRLKKIQKAKIAFDDLWVAHELAGEVPSGRPLHVDDFLPRSPNQKNWLYPLLNRLMGMAEAALVQTDPLLFGVKTVKDTSDLYLIGAWTYGS
jgi:hypothetical protein